MSPLLPDVNKKNCLRYHVDSAREISSFQTESPAFRIDCQNMLSLQLLLALSNQEWMLNGMMLSGNMIGQPMSLQLVFNSS